MTSKTTRRAAARDGTVSPQRTTSGQRDVEVTPIRPPTRSARGQSMESAAATALAAKKRARQTSNQSVENGRGETGGEELGPSRKRTRKDASTDQRKLLAIATNTR
jgi:hypothetical protein